MARKIPRLPQDAKVLDYRNAQRVSVEDQTARGTRTSSSVVFLEDSSASSSNNSVNGPEYPTKNTVVPLLQGYISDDENDVQNSSEEEPTPPGLGDAGTSSIRIPRRRRRLDYNAFGKDGSRKYLDEPESE
ncbi:hypothetical protein FOL47_000780 [Perkinsus chesapeaki]|uniref:Uncharacterized protein n=1 Tax=Perkinsus chesapeaki TaxID=330153 RepID=A0A7J6KWC8_PERCH|nr:hypothetical protein FOL47_000780 [Perkinsus chesapeaki]